MSARILVVEDEPATRALVVEYLREQGFDLTTAGTAAEARSALDRFRPDLVLLDRRLPDGDGLDLARELRARGDLGLIFVTSVGGEIDSVLGLEMGADDYVTKPIALRELLARIRATLRRIEALRRAQPPSAPAKRWRVGPWLVDAELRRVTDAEGGELELTRAEFDLFAALAEANGRPLSRAYLMEMISERADDATERTVDTLVSRIRRKLARHPGGDALIETARSIGYRVAV